MNRIKTLILILTAAAVAALFGAGSAAAANPTAVPYAVEGASDLTPGPGGNLWYTTLQGRTTGAHVRLFFGQRREMQLFGHEIDVDRQRSQRDLRPAGQQQRQRADGNQNGRVDDKADEPGCRFAAAWQPESADAKLPTMPNVRQRRQHDRAHPIPVTTYFYSQQ